MKKNQNSLMQNSKALLSVSMMVLFFSSVSNAELGDSFILCKSNKNVRTLRVEMSSDQKCRAVYTKQGVDEVIGASTGAAACAEIISNVRKNLEEGKWNCREVKESRTSSVTTVVE